jgi:hypothetical protein
MFDLACCDCRTAISQDPNTGSKKLPMSVTKAISLLSSLFMTAANHSGEERYERACDSRISREVDRSSR